MEFNKFITYFYFIEFIFDSLIFCNFNLIIFSRTIFVKSNYNILIFFVFSIVDGVSQTNDLTSGYSDLPMFIAKDLTVTGTATFIVPKTATSYDIRYGDYITVHIEK